MRMTRRLVATLAAGACLATLGAVPSASGAGTTSAWIDPRGAGWATAAPPSRTGNWANVSAVVDRAGRLHITGTRVPTVGVGQITYAGPGGEKVVEKVVPSFDEPTIAINKANQPAIAWQANAVVRKRNWNGAVINRLQRQIRVAAGPQWRPGITDIPRAAGPYGWRTELAVDAITGDPSLVYMTHFGGLMHQDADGQVTQIRKDKVIETRYAASAGVQAVAFYTGAQLFTAVRRSVKGTWALWQVRPVDATVNGFDIAVTRTGSVRLVWSPRGASLRVLDLTPGPTGLLPASTFVTVPGVSLQITDVSIAVDDAGNTHVAYEGYRTSLCQAVTLAPTYCPSTGIEYVRIPADLATVADMAIASMVTPSIGHVPSFTIVADRLGRTATIIMVTPAGTLEMRRSSVAAAITPAPTP